MEERWRKAWEAQGTYRTPDPSCRSTESPGAYPAPASTNSPGAYPAPASKQYVLDFFPYPSGEGLSVGHARNYVPTDVLARYFRMRGDAVLHPMGWDAFGLPAENEALLRGRHPAVTTREYATTYRRQLRLLGCSYDWEREITTSDPAYYRWTQWTFLLLLRLELAYRAAGWQWWCPRCRTILANEQVEEGRCWRHNDTPVERRLLQQWYVRTTRHAQRLLDGLASLDWPEHVKAMQRHWIGRSEGAEVVFRLRGSAQAIVVFTTRVDTVFGVTFLALAPEHDMAAQIATPDRRAAVDAYIAAALRRSEVDRMTHGRSPGGMFTGAYAVHPLSSEALPVFVADYVLPHYGTAAVMGVPGHDARDFAFASQQRLPIRRVVVPEAGTGAAVEGPSAGEGVLISSGEFDGLSTARARVSIAAALAQAGAGHAAVRYRMRDWLISRQRFWGAPIPVVYCDACGIVSVPEAELPVLLPEIERYDPSGTGESPLAAMPAFVHTSCPTCTGPARRETDTLDGFADSNWYFLRFADPGYADGPWNPKAVRAWLPVDWYVGGAEHAVMHLLYARFFTQVLHDAGIVAFDEPFRRLRNQGSMLSPEDGARMSKSRGNIITPDEVVARHGADALRVYALFIGPFDQDVTWDPRGITGSERFVRRLFGLLARAAVYATPVAEAGDADAHRDPSDADIQVMNLRLQRLIRDAGAMIEEFRFNVLVAEMMAFLREAEGWEPRWRGMPFWGHLVETLARLAAPIAPFLAEEAWHRLGKAGSVHLAPWPTFDPALISTSERTVVVQVNGRPRDRLTVSLEADQEVLLRAALSRERVQRALAGREVDRVVIVPGQVINLVVRG